MTSKLLLILLSTILFSCNDKLTRDDAEKLILEKFQYPKDEIRPFLIGDNTVGMKQTAKLFETLQKEKMLTYTFDNRLFFGGTEAILTTEGEKYAVSKKYTSNKYVLYIDVKTAKLHFGAITGIQEHEELKVAEVEYTIIRKDITPFGKYAFAPEKDTIKKRITFNKYDDGWRINE